VLSCEKKIIVIKHKFILVFLLLSLKLSLFSQNCQVSGYVTDGKTGEKLIGVNIKENKTGRGCTSNNFGFFSFLGICNDSVELKLSYIGYRSTTLKVLVSKKQNIHVSMFEEDQDIEQVDVVARRFSNIHQNNIVNISMKEIKHLPAIFGETDVLRAYMLMPGVQGGKEGTSELYVRGGTPDQNLVILDDIPLYYINHIGGFVSIFDNNALKNIDLIKGGFPARYGGRLSAVTDIRMKDGNMKKMGGGFTLGLFSSKILLEGPIKKDKSSFLITARRSIFDVFTRPISYLVDNGKTSAGYTFYDVNAKFQQRLSEKDRLYLSFYSGRDRIFMNFNEKDSEKKYSITNNLQWGNILAAIRWNHQFAPKLFLNLTIAYTQFSYKTDFEYLSRYLSGKKDEKYVNSYLSDISDYIFKLDFDYFANDKHTLKIGANSTFHNYKPGVVSFKKIYGKAQDIDTTFGSQTLSSVEAYFYAEDEIKISKNIHANIGVHYSLFKIEDELFQSLQPRIIASWYITSGFALKASYSKMSQNIHLLTNSSSSQPTDLWVPATSKLKPENAQQFSFGLNKLLKKGMFELSVDAYYKTMDHLIEYKEGASFFSTSKGWQDKVETGGTGTVYGLEFLLRKRTGKTKGWLAYTLSKNERYFENLNFGKPYPFKYDRRHDIAIVVTHQIKSNIILSASWTFNSGYYLSLAEGKYNNIANSQNNPLPDIFPGDMPILPSLSYNNAYIYNGKNNYQTNNYHRLDISSSFVKKKKRGVRTLILGFYNLYSRLNPYFIYYKYEKKQLKLYQFSLFPFMPSVSYSFKF